MYCTNCGANNPDAAKYCQKCGSALPGSAPEFAPPTPLTAIPAAAAVHAPTVHYAGFWRRWVAYVIDGLILSVINTIVVLIFFLRLLQRILLFTNGFCDVDMLTGLAAASVVMDIVIFAIVLWLIKYLYFSAFESSRSQATPGKMALGIIVTDGQYQRLSFARALGRNLGKILSNMILMIGYIMAGFTARKQALHDMLADCVVILRPTAR